MGNETDWENVSAEVNRRREARLTMRFPIEVSGFDRAGKFFSEKTSTENISEHGCRFQLKAAIAASSVLAVKLLSSSGEAANPEKPVLYQIARVDKSSEGLLVGACKLQPETMWCVSFPKKEGPATPQG